MKLLHLVWACAAVTAVAGPARDRRDISRPREEFAARMKKEYQRFRQTQALVRLRAAGFNQEQLRALSDSVTPHSEQARATRTLIGFVLKMKPSSSRFNAKQIATDALYARLQERSTWIAAFETRRTATESDIQRAVRNMIRTVVAQARRMTSQFDLSSFDSEDADAMGFVVPQASARVRALRHLRHEFKLPLDTLGSLSVADTRVELETLARNEDAETQRLIEALLTLHPALQPE